MKFCVSFLKKLALAVVTTEAEHIIICICKYVYLYAYWFILIYILLALQAFTNCVHGYDSAHNVHAKGVTRSRKCVHGIDYSV